MSEFFDSIAITVDTEVIAKQTAMNARETIVIVIRSKYPGVRIDVARIEVARHGRARAIIGIAILLSKTSLRLNG